jgi:phosphoglycolate phosphatase
MGGPDAGRSYEAIVYDLDGTLVHLDVDWDRVRQEVGETLAEHGVDSEGMDLWEMLKRSRDDCVLAEDVETTIAKHEREGARRCDREDCASQLLAHPDDLPVGVCSLNCEAAARLALECHGLDEYVTEVVGRDTLATEKPDPEPLLQTLDGLGVSADEAVFVGDSGRDAMTAERAGVPFRYVEEWV